MKLFDYMDENTLKQCMETAKNLDYDGMLKILEQALDNISALTPAQWLALATLGFYLMNDKDRDRVLKRRIRHIEELER
jgi:hypothetical protein